LARSSSGLGHHPLKVAARVRIPYGLPSETPGQRPAPAGLFPFPASIAHGLPMNDNGGHAMKGSMRQRGVGVGAQGLPWRRPGQREAALCHEDGPRGQARGTAVAQRDEGRGRAQPGDEDHSDGGGTARPLAPGSIRRIHGILRRAPGAGRAVGRLGVNPAAATSPPRVPMPDSAADMPASFGLRSRHTHDARSPSL
jgi:hypothetical protein